MSAIADDGAGEPRESRPQRSVRQTLGTLVLGFEVIVVFLAALVIWGLAREVGAWGLPTWVPLAVGGAVVLALIVTIGLLRFHWGFIVGWVLQGIILASGLLNPAMFVVGIIFGGMWWYCMVAGSRIDRQRAAAGGPETESA